MRGKNLTKTDYYMVTLLRTREKKMKKKRITEDHFNSTGVQAMTGSAEVSKTTPFITLGT